jgi:hypothetical protein
MGERGSTYMPAYYIVGLNYKVLLISVHHFLSLLLLLLPISLVLSDMDAITLEKRLPIIAIFFFLRLSRPISQTIKNPGPRSTLYRKLFELRESQIFLKQIVLAAVIPSPVMGAISAAYRRVQSRVCAALSIHDGCVMS